MRLTIFPLWLEKWESLAKEEAGKKKDIFKELIDLCAEIYPCLANLVCKHFILTSPIKYK